MQLFLDLLCLIVVVICAYTDLTKRKIYNIVTLPAVGFSLLITLVMSPGDLFLNNLTAFMFAFIVFALFFSMRIIGGGDVKLMSAVGAMSGFPLIIDVMFVSALIAGVYSFVVLLKNRIFLKYLKETFRVLILFKNDNNMKNESFCIPFGFCIGLATIISLATHYFINIESIFYKYLEINIFN